MSGDLAKQSAPEYQGVVAEWPGFRVIVAREAAGSFYYRLQALLPVCFAPALQWVPIDRSSSPTLAKLLAKLDASTAGLALAVQGLPEDPAKASHALNAIYLAMDARG